MAKPAQTVLDGSERWGLLQGDCLEVLPMLPASSVDAIVTDPPYFRVKGHAWDRQWDTPGGFIEWLSRVADEWQRVLKPNGSLYCFASPRMAAHVEVMLSRRFDVLNHIVWQKELDRGKHAASCKESLRAFFPNTERIIFAEHIGSDNIAKGEAGYAAKCDELRGFVFEPIRAYLSGERDRAGWTTRRVAEAFQQKTGSRTVTGMAGHWFERVQWSLPTRANYEWLRCLFNEGGNEYLRRDYEYLRRDYEELRRDYEELRRQYDELRRPFAVTSSVPYTDVWNFPTVPFYPGKHPCEKPQELLAHILTASTRPDAVVLDTFAGGGSLGETCKRLGRRFIGIELDEQYANAATARLRAKSDLFAEAR